MGIHSITLNYESEEMLKRWKVEDNSFNFSKFIQEAMRNDTSVLTEEQIKHRIKMDKIEVEALTSKIAHFEMVLPIAIEREKVYKSKEKQRIDETIESYRTAAKYRPWTQEKAESWAKIHGTTLGIDYKELLRMCADE